MSNSTTRFLPDRFQYYTFENISIYMLMWSQEPFPPKVKAEIDAGVKIVSRLIGDSPCPLLIIYMDVYCNSY